MTLEVSAYLPDALSSTSEIRGTAHSASEKPSDVLDNIQPQLDRLERPADASIQIAEISDETLLEQVRQGAKEALGILFRRHAHTVRNVAYRILRNEAEADDLVQDVFIFIFRKATLFNAAHCTARPGSSRLPIIAHSTVVAVSSQDTSIPVVNLTMLR
jgi:RNA polymerase sigma-70 factor (ECF subfamily)